MSHTANVRRVLEQERARNAHKSPDDGYWGRLSQKFYESAEARDHYEFREAQRQEAWQRENDPKQIAYYNLTPDEWKAFAVREAMSEQEKVAQLATGNDLSDFIADHSEYIDSVQNGKEMKKALKLLRLKYPTREQIEHVYQTLREEGVLELDPKEVVKQEKEAYKQRAEDFRASRIMPSEEELAEMPLQEIRRRANGY